MKWLKEWLSAGASPNVGRRLEQYQRREMIILWAGGGLAAIVALFTAIEFTRESDLPVEVLPVVPVSVVFGGFCLAISRIQFEWQAVVLRRGIQDGHFSRDDDLQESTSRSSNVSSTFYDLPRDYTQWPVGAELFYRLLLLVTAFGGVWIVVIAIWSAVIGPHPVETQVATPTAPPASIEEFGGPYPRAGNEIGPQKIADFGFYFAKEIFYSQGKKLEPGLLEMSVAVYMNDGFPHAQEFQRYNYVIDEHDNIFVATWGNNLDFDEIDRGTCKTATAAATPTAGGSDSIDTDDDGETQGFPKAREGEMINFYPEDPIKSAHGKQSPCWIAVAGSDEPAGLLDASSKHFMLAQKEGHRSIQKYMPEVWTQAKVKYAGEIIVEITRGNAGNVLMCEYTLNGNSGTYKPANGMNLKKVADLFGEVLEVAPAYTWVFDHEDRDVDRQFNDQRIQNEDQKPTAWACGP